MNHRIAVCYHKFGIAECSPRRCQSIGHFGHTNSYECMAWVDFMNLTVKDERSLRNRQCLGKLILRTYSKLCRGQIYHMMCICKNQKPKKKNILNRLDPHPALQSISKNTSKVISSRCSPTSCQEVPAQYFSR
jgi:hypothetical protein